MSRLSRNEIDREIEELTVNTEEKSEQQITQELSAAAFAKHQQMLKPKRRLESDVRPDWMQNTCPKDRNGKIIQPMSPQ
jgi:hypothetical protein